LTIVVLVYLLGPILSPFLFGAVLAYIGSPNGRVGCAPTGFRECSARCSLSRE
jgi:hypothetical protein